LVTIKLGCVRSSAENDLAAHWLLRQHHVGAKPRLTNPEFA